MATADVALVGEGTWDKQKQLGLNTRLLIFPRLVVHCVVLVIGVFILLYVNNSVAGLFKDSRAEVTDELPCCLLLLLASCGVCYQERGITYHKECENANHHKHPIDRFNSVSAPATSTYCTTNVEPLPRRHGNESLQEPKQAKREKSLEKMERPSRRFIVNRAHSLDV